MIIIVLGQISRSCFNDLYNGNKKKEAYEQGAVVVGNSILLNETYTTRENSGPSHLYSLFFRSWFRFFYFILFYFILFFLHLPSNPISEKKK